MSTDIDARRKVAAILRVLADTGHPLGGTRIAHALRLRGIDLRHRMVRYYLEEMDALGLTENLGRPGRKLTDRGRRELDSAVAVDRVGFLAARIDEFAWRQTFDPDRGSGTIVLNVSSLPADHSVRARKLIRKVLGAGLGAGRLVAVAEGQAPWKVRPALTGVAEAGEGLADFRVPRGTTAFGTVCSVTVTGVLNAAGIPTTARFGGLLELRERRPFRFTQIISYDATTIDPVEIFIKGRMTSVKGASQSGAGTIGASFHDIPAAALPEAAEAVRKLERLGLGCVLEIGAPGRPLLDVSVPHGRVGLVLASGLNPIAAVEEAGIPTENRTMAALCEFDRLTPAASM